MKRTEIEHELIRLGAPASRLGYRQMVHALELILQQRDEVIPTTSELYPRVAETLHTNALRVERNIREEIAAIWNRGNQKRLNELFVSRTPYPPGAKEFLYTLARRFQQEHAI